MRTRRDLLTAHRSLLRRYGHQHWWPVYELENRRIGEQEHIATFDLIRRPCPKRLTDANRFQICVGAILTQNAAWTNVERALGALITARATTPRAISAMRLARLTRLIRPAGYFNQKARKLRIFSRWLLREYGGSLERFFRLSTDDCRLQLLALWGIGPETADSMLLYAGRHSVFVVDAYTKRWLAQGSFRLSAPSARLRTYDECQRFFTDRLSHDARLFNEFHALIVAWGKTQRYD